MGLSLLSCISSVESSPRKKARIALSEVENLIRLDNTVVTQDFDLWAWLEIVYPFEAENHKRYENQCSIREGRGAALYCDYDKIIFKL